MSQENAVAVVRVLLLDDEPDVGRALVRLLKHEGFSPDYFDDCAPALEAARSGVYDVLVSDIAMPGMDGIEFMRQVRAFDYDVPIILLTGAPTIDSARKAIELGAYRYLTKPFDQEELVAAVRGAAFAHRMAHIKRQTARLHGQDDAMPSDLLGLNIAFEAALSTLWMAYQPIVRASDGTVFAYEALMRSESRTLPHPGAILDAAERLGRLTDLSRRIRELAPRPFLENRTDALLFLNLHPRDLADPHLLDASTELARMAPRVVLEITERAELEKVPGAMEALGQLRARDFRVAVDDLGSGYSGLTSFAMLEPDVVKLDMALVRGVDAHPTKRKLVKSVVELSREMKVLVVAEGIETPAERDTCRELGVDLLQGFLIARPGPAFPAVSPW